MPYELSYLVLTSPFSVCIPFLLYHICYESLLSSRFFKCLCFLLPKRNSLNLFEIITLNNLNAVV